MTHQLTVSDLQTFIDRHQIQARLIAGIGHTPTVPAAALALGVEPEQIIKTLLFLVDRPDAANTSAQPVIVISNGESRVNKKIIARHLGVGGKRVKLASPEIVLAVLGFPAGGVPPFGYHSSLPVIVDTAVVALKERFGGQIFGGGGDAHTMMELSVGELLRVLQPEIVPVS